MRANFEDNNRLKLEYRYYIKTHYLLCQTFNALRQNGTRVTRGGAFIHSLWNFAFETSSHLSLPLMNRCDKTKSAISPTQTSIQDTMMTTRFTLFTRLKGTIFIAF